MSLYWLRSRTVRRAYELQRQVKRLVNEQRDLLAPDAIAAIDAAADRLHDCLARTEPKQTLESAMADLIDAAEKNFVPYPHPVIRENIKEFFTAAVVILAFTTFFLQLTKIPTGSMQPTLFGITSEDLRQTDAVVPGPLLRFFHYVWNGVAFHHVVADADGELIEVSPPKRVLPLVKKQDIRVGSATYTVWFPPDDLERRAGLRPGQFFRAGEAIVKLKVVSGDHLLVDRFTYNFRRPQRGEIIVFKTRGIPNLDRDHPDQLYIKRLVALGGEHVRIGDDHHLIVDGRRLDAATPRFENLYTFAVPPKPNHYFGHVNQRAARRWSYSQVAPLFQDESREFVVRPRHYLAMGDNTLNSRDSREWGDLPQQNVIGKCWFVYWPFSIRFGWGYR